MARWRRPWVERAWSGEGGAFAAALRPLEALYAAASAVSRARAARTRRRVDGIEVVAIGGLTAGGSGKTSLARWAATTALELGRRPALLLRGHGSEAASGRVRLVPFDAKREAMDAGADRALEARHFGDEAMAHRATLPAGVLVVAGRDRAEGAALALANSADLAILDDGWEQGTLAWDSLWVVLDPVRPVANGHQLPAGPLRRPVSNLFNSNVIVSIADVVDELESIPRDWAAVPGAAAGDGPVRFRRRLEGWTPLPGSERPEATAPGPSLLLSSVGSPARLERFLRGAGLDLRHHVAFADHAPWNVGAILEAVRRLQAESGGRGSIVVSDKDAGRASRLFAVTGVGIPAWVARSSVHPHDDPAPLRAALRGGVAAPPAIR